MDKLTKFLRNQGYDLIEGPVRNHKPLQLWLKQIFNEAEIYYTEINHAFSSNVSLKVEVNPALSVNTSIKDDYGFNIGMTILENSLKTLGLGAFELSSQVKSGKKVTISYDNSITEEVAIGEIENYLTSADFKHLNPILLRNANRNNILLITGVVSAQNLVVEIETNFSLDANLIASLNKVAEGKLDFSMVSEKIIKMVSVGSNFFPVAVKASRIDFDKGSFEKLTLVTDNRNFF